MSKKFLKVLDFLVVICYNTFAIKYLLIKSGGGTGPMKPGNLFNYKVLIPER